MDPGWLGPFDIVVKMVGHAGLSRRDQLGSQPEVVSLASRVTERPSWLRVVSDPSAGV